MRYISLDIEAIGLNPYGGTIWSLAITEGKKTTLYEDCYGLKKLPKKVLDDLANPNVCKIIHSSEYDVPYIGLVLGAVIRNIWDSQLNEIVIQGRRVNKDAPEAMQERYSSKLEYVLPRYGFKKPNKETRKLFINRPLGVPFKKLEKSYMTDDVKDLPAIQKAQEFLLTRDGLLNVALLENKTAEKVAQMRIHGIGFNPDTWKRIAEENTVEYNKRIAKLPKTVSNWNSNQQVKKFFADRGIIIPTYKDIYKIYLRKPDKVLAEFIWAKELNKAVTTYGMNWFEAGYIDPDNRIRYNVDQIVDTGRMSISNPPLQQMPGVDIKNAQKQRAINMIIAQLKLSGRLIPQHRTAFIAKKGCKLVKGDFSGQEMGVMAAASGESLWIEAMLRGEDIHALTASLLYQDEWRAGTEKGCKFPFKCSCKKHKALREPTKILNFMLAYGGGPQRFAEDTGIDELTARVIVGKYKRIIPKLTAWLERNGREALDTGVSFSADPYKRRRVLHGEEPWQIKNQGKNTPIQAAGANMLKLAMISIPDKYPIVLVIHDEIVLEVKTAEAPKAAKLLKQVMEQSADYITGIKGLIKVEPQISDTLAK